LFFTLICKDNKINPLMEISYLEVYKWLIWLNLQIPEHSSRSIVNLQNQTFGIGTFPGNSKCIACGIGIDIYRFLVDFQFLFTKTKALIGNGR